MSEFPALDRSVLLDFQKDLDWAEKQEATAKAVYDEARALTHVLRWQICNLEKAYREVGVVS